MVNKFWSLSALVLMAACAKGKGDAAPADTAAAAAAPAQALAADTGMKMAGDMKMDAEAGLP